MISRDHPGLDELAPVDGFHIRSREATRELLEDLSLPEGPEVFDAGCGIGGTGTLTAYPMDNVQIVRTGYSTIEFDAKANNTYIFRPR